VCCTTYRTERKTCYRDVCYTVCKPVTTYKEVQECCGSWKTVTEHCPGPVVEKCVREPGTWEWDENGCCSVYKPGCCKTVKVQCPGTTICRKVWCPKTVTRRIACTHYVKEVKHCKVPYTVCKRIPCTTTKKVPYTCTRYVQECRTKKVAYTTCTMVKQCCTKRVPYRVCTMKEYCYTKKVPYTTCTMVEQCCTRRVPYRTCSYVTETRTRKIPYTTCERVCYTKYITKRRCVPRQVCYTRTKCVPRVVCRKVPVQVCCPAPKKCCG
jgi:hypothetical protein